MSYRIDDSTVIALNFEDTISDLTGNFVSFSSNLFLDDNGKFGKCIYGNKYTSSNMTLNKPFGELMNTDGDYTVDFWFKTLDSSTGARHILKGSSSSSNLTLSMYYNKTQLKLYPRINGDDFTEDCIENYNLGDWVHVAIVREGDLTYCFLNGKKSSTTTSSRKFTNDTSKSLTFLYSSTPSYVGYVDDFRITGKALFTENFTPTNKPLSNPLYPNILNSTEKLCSIKADRDMDKIEVYINNSLDKEYLNLKKDTITIHNYNLELLGEGDNTIKVIGYINDIDYPIEFTYKDLPPLSHLATFNTICERFNTFLERKKEENNIFIKILKDKGITNDLNGLRHEELMEYVRLLGNYTPPTEDEIQPPKEPIEITSVSEEWGTAYINVSSGLVDDEAVDLYIDDVFKNTYYYRSGQVQTISTSVILNKTIQLKTTDGRVSNKYYVESFS